jgi:hypothetical protein
VNIRRDLELAVAPAREQADMQLVRVESIFVTSRVHIGSVRPRAASGAGLVPARAACAVIPTGAATGGFEVFAPPGGLVIPPAAGPPVKGGVERFADPPFAIPLEPVVGGGESERITAHDSSSVRWRFRLTARQAVTVSTGAE